MAAGTAWVAERVGQCDGCHGEGLELCEVPGPGAWDYCGRCWWALRMGGA